MQPPEWDITCRTCQAIPGTPCDTPVGSHPSRLDEWLVQQHTAPAIPLWAAPLLAPIAAVAEPVVVSEPEPGLLRADLAGGATAYIRRPPEAHPR